MTKRLTKDKQVKYCACCNQICNGHPVVRTDHALIYLKKQGYEVYSLAKPFNSWFKFIFLAIFIFSMIPLSSAVAVPSLVVDFSKNINIFILALSFGLAITLFFFRQFKFSGLILLLNGFIMLMSDLNFYFTFFVFLSAGIVSSMGGKS